MKLSWYRISCKPDRQPHSVQECEDVINFSTLPEKGFVREYRTWEGAPDPGPITLREYWMQAFDVLDALERWKKAGE